MDIAELKAALHHVNGAAPAQTRANAMVFTVPAQLEAVGTVDHKLAKAMASGEDV